RGVTGSTVAPRSSFGDFRGPPDETVTPAPSASEEPPLGRRVPPAMNCRQFRNHHVPFVDDVLSAADMRAMREHLARCESCARLDVRIRRSLMIVRSLPQIDVSTDFAPRLEARLRRVQ